MHCRCMVHMVLTIGTVRPHYPSSSSQQVEQPYLYLHVDDITEKSIEAWEELFINAYNRGTLMHSVEAFQTLPLVSAPGSSSWLEWNVD